ncbi:uncharacterized protein LOC133495980 [Syngnathoides biaculeatus]|uniref:uncharacterized protein LOC133495980 n=1 Tax=Syngnathoides biaculeatus TaxID=300417 RepID=UPI002ADDE74E|nr:uncharacterized protein LOC133495980 [Syngnathoides biaculeatus]
MSHSSTLVLLIEPVCTDLRPFSDQPFSGRVMIFFQGIVLCFFVSDLHSSAVHALEMCQTAWFDDGDVSEDGDSELLTDLRRKHGTRICSDPVDMETQTVAGIKSEHTTNIFHTHSPSEGLLCLNREQFGSLCVDYKVKFTCSGQFCSECQTGWFDMDDPEGHGDFELLSDLRQKYPGKICHQPVAIQVQTVSAESASSTPETFLRLDAAYGFACVNADQTDKSCEDYKVRFTCPKEFCQKSQECRTQWLDSDDPSDEGDVESLYRLLKTYPGQVCRNPIRIEARTTNGLSSELTGDVFLSNDVTFGFACINENQPTNQQCADYEVMMTCPSDFCHMTGCRTRWFDLDDPTSDGDYETLVELQRVNAAEVCPQPVAVEAMTTSGIPAHETGDVFQMYDATHGFACVNREQPSEKQCQDYQVRLTCPPAFCSI